jgi:glycosyltransferase involved in cell wall biosynthesis
MSLNPRFTVYIASHNYGIFLGEAIESVFSQTVDDWELILIDDGSTDETPQIINLYQGHPKVSAYRTETIGLPSVCNFALSKAKGKYIIRLDGDDVFDENILLVLGNRLDQDSELALVFPDYYLIDEAGEIFSHVRRLRLHLDDHLMEIPPNGACTLVKTKVLKELGGYREDLGAQDGLDLWVKIKDDFKTENVNLPLFYYRRHGKNLTERPLTIINARRELKKDASIGKLEYMNPIIAVIPCRRHYDFVEDLWNVTLLGKTLLERDIEICLNSTIIDNIVVTCDNPIAEKTVLSFENPRVSFILRDEKSTFRSSNIVNTLKVIVNQLDPQYHGITLMRYIQTPFISTGTIEEAITSLVVSDADSANAIEKINGCIYRRTSFGLESINMDLGQLVGSETLYRDSSTCVATRNSNLKKGSLTGSIIAGFVVSSAESFYIASTHDLEVARSLAVQTDQKN